MCDTVQNYIFGCWVIGVFCCCCCCCYFIYNDCTLKMASRIIDFPNAYVMDH